MHVDTNSCKFRVIEKYWGRFYQKWVWQLWSQDSKIEFSQEAVSQERIDGINGFFAWNANPRKLKVDIIIFGFSYLKMGAFLNHGTLTKISEVG